ncbi:MAG: hypothetical protein AAGD92_14050 [Pseudomonadota bacterium]
MARSFVAAFLSCLLSPFLFVQSAAQSPAQPIAPSIAQPATCDYGAPHPNAPAEMSQFAFLIGDYAVSLHAWRGEAWSPPQPGKTARWNGRYGLGGMAVIDEWFNPDPEQDPDAPRGVNVRMYDPDAAEWDMMWVAAPGHQVQDLRAKVKDGVLTMWQVYPEREDFYAEFVVEDDNRWSRVSYGKDDEGNWVKQFKLSASRIPCASQ